MATHLCPGHERLLAGIPVRLRPRPADLTEVISDLQSRLSRSGGRQGGIVLSKRNAQAIVAALLAAPTPGGTTEHG
jgi:hypothetical protein